MADVKQSNELVLSNGEFAYTQDATSGIIKVLTGPIVVNTTGQEYPVVYDPVARKLVRVELAAAAQLCAFAAQGYYIELTNPPVEGRSQPQEKGKEVSPELRMGQKVNIPGPATFALWHRQHARVIKGHQLRSNEYLLVRVYDEEAAIKNWSNAIVKGVRSDDAAQEEQTPQIAQKDLSVGKLFTIKGTEVSFFIPPTGIEVVVDDNNQFVREALTLERLQYCILIDEDGNKVYKRGPMVVFPKPTERFFCQRDRDGREQKVFSPIELNEIQGVHIKVIADYTEDGRQYHEGDELFLTGKDIPIYFPRQEHSLISYDGHSKHYATAVPSGEARYVMERTTGNIRMERGPTMLLPDPRTEVVVRRVLADKQCSLWYPGNKEVQEYNNALRDLLRQSPTTRTGTVSEGEIERARSLRKISNTVLAGSTVNQDTKAVLADQFTRGSTYTQPRTITLDTKFSGVPTVDVWTGYAVLVVSKTGKRRVEVGPKTVLLEYDESLEVLGLSTGKPKTTDTLLHTVYLKVRNNQVSDLVRVETADHVPVNLKVSYRIDFDGEPERWFDVENYIKLLSDHTRSILKGRVRKLSIEQFYADPTSIVRDTLLGEKQDGVRTGLRFAENGMVLRDIEVLDVTILNESIAKLLHAAQHDAVQSVIGLAKAERELVVLQRQEAIERQSEAELATTHQIRLVREKEKIALEHDVAVDRQTALRAVEEMTLALLDTKKKAELARLDAEKRLSLDHARAVLEIDCAKIKAETESVVQRFEAAQKGLSDAIVTIGNQDVLARVAEAASVQTFLGGRNLTEVFQKMFGGSALASVLETVTQKAQISGQK